MMTKKLYLPGHKSAAQNPSQLPSTGGVPGVGMYGG